MILSTWHCPHNIVPTHHLNLSLSPLKPLSFSPLQLSLSQLQLQSLSPLRLEESASILSVEINFHTEVQSDLHLCPHSNTHRGSLSDSAHIQTCILVLVHIHIHLICHTSTLRLVSQSTFLFASCMVHIHIHLICHSSPCVIVHTLSIQKGTPISTLDCSGRQSQHNKKWTILPPEWKSRQSQHLIEEVDNFNIWLKRLTILTLDWRDRQYRPLIERQSWLSRHWLKKRTILTY